MYEEDSHVSMLVLVVSLHNLAHIKVYIPIQTELKCQYISFSAVYFVLLIVV
jgi:hypothetical protein